MQIAARAGIHGGDQHKLGRIGQGRVDTYQVNHPVFQGLTQYFQDGAGKFGQLVEKEDALMAERHFPRFRYGTAANEACCRNGVMRTAERAFQKAPFLVKESGNTVNLCHFQGLFYIHGR